MTASASSSCAKWGTARTSTAERYAAGPLVPICLRPTDTRRFPSQRSYITPAEEMAQLLGVAYERMAHTERLRLAQHGRWGLN